jgi:hypothetical protein
MGKDARTTRRRSDLPQSCIQESNKSSLKNVQTSSDFEIKVRKPRILFFDIEVSPTIAAVWSPYEANAIWVEQYSQVLCWSAKWQGGKHLTKAQCDMEGYVPGVLNDLALITELHTMMCSADVLVAHNGDSFDVKVMKAMFIRNGLPPTPPVKSIDTKKGAKGEFRFFSNRLDSIGDELGIGRKVSTGGFDLWRDCMKGDAKAWNRMKRYNKGDVTLLENTYNKLMPWMQRHPNIGLFMGLSDACRNCGGTDLQKRGFRYTATGHNPRYKCNNCGCYSTGKHTKLTEIR